MLRAIELAKGGMGKVDPNPMVGAVIVKDNRIIGEGFHERYGGPHAERNAIASLTEDATGADMYVTLEPCAHHGKTPPCTEAIIESGISKVLIGSKDPNPLVSGKGVEALREAGIEVVEDFCRTRCDELNYRFFQFITTGKPYVLLKYAMTADGKIATHTGASRWISCEKSRDYVQRLRNEYPAILAGIGTVLADDPQLTTRIPGGTNPLRIITDSSLRIPEDCNIIKTAGDVPTMIVCAMKEKTFAASDKRRTLENAGARVVNLPGEDGQVDFKALVELLGEEKITGLLIEGGSDVNYSALQSGIVDEVNVFLAPKVFGGNAKTPVGGAGVELPDEAFPMKLVSFETVGDDLLIKYRLS